MDLSKEKGLIEKAKKDPEAFGKIFDENYPKIFGYILKRVANLEIAQDVTSETFLKALKNLWKFRWRNIPFSAWLYRIANNEIANFFRKRKYKSVSLEKIPEPIAVSNPSIEIIEAQEKLKAHKDFLALQEKILRLPLKYQEVISLRFFEKKKIREIAEILGKKEGTIKSLLRRGLEKLREKFNATF
ncbi:RNA polymerase sigma factor [Patescibacteria group bacterium]|nr:RNA polymerase sigma factor [Patescibacteria group bacterium]